jgi:hypothetical protein
MRVHEIVRLLPEARGTYETKKRYKSIVYLQNSEAAGTLRTPSYFPMQNLEKITPSRSSAPNSPVIDPSRS